jgi:hypothetical protein
LLPANSKFTETRYIANVLETVRKKWRFFSVATAAALALRLLFVLRFPAVVTDSFVYVDIAKNWLLHGVYGLSGDSISPTYIRLPGYPAFLAFVFAIFGVEHYRTVLITQIFIDVGTCFLCADIALRILGEKSVKAAFLLAGLCPFLANYSAAALTETLEVFFTALALDFALKASQSAKIMEWLGCGLACAGAILLRPDGVLLFVAIEAYLASQLISRRRPGSNWASISAACLLAIIVILLLAPWTLRNWKVFHRFQPLTPRYVNEAGEFVPLGFNRWVNTWMADYVSVEEIYWQVPGSPIPAEKLPARAFDNAEQQKKTTAVIDEYNQSLEVSRELDSKFAALASERISNNPLRYYFNLPLLRIADMWLRPRTEMLPSDSRWWEFNDEPRWSTLAIALGLINLFYVLSAAAGTLQFRGIPGFEPLILFALLRSAFLGTLENPEPRYTLEMYPAVIVFAAAAISARKKSA